VDGAGQKLLPVPVLSGDEYGPSAWASMGSRESTFRTAGALPMIPGTTSW